MRPLASDGHVRAPPLGQDLRTEIAVVGGGVAGLSCAQALVASGRKVVLLERDACGSGASGRSSGFVTPDAEMELDDLLRRRGPQAAKRLWDFAVGGVDLLRASIAEHAIDCDLAVQDSLFAASSRKGAKVVRAEHAARKSLGYESTLYDAATIRSALGSDEFHGGVRYSGTFGIDALRYCRAMRDVLRDSGAVIHEGTAAESAGAGEVVANGHRVRADTIVLCLDRFLPDVGVLRQEIYHAQTFLAVSSPLSDRDVAAIFPAGPLMVWDTDLVYQYFRLAGEQRLLVGGGTLLHTYDREESATAPGVLEKMRAWLARTFPAVRVEIERFRPGLIGVSKDFLPLAARDARDSTLCIVGGAAGLPWAAALGRYMAEKIVSGRSDLDLELDPCRPFPVGPRVQALLGKPAAFALSHAIAKYLR